MIVVKPLETLDSEDVRRIIAGYTSSSKYTLERIESEGGVNFALKRVDLDSPYIKHYTHLDDATLEHYQEVLRHKLSFGVTDQGVMVALAIAEPQTWNASVSVWEFHVAESHRGRGIGRRLMNALIEGSRQRGMRVIVCETQNTNAPAIAFYRHLGFTLDGLDLSLYTNQDWPDGEIALFMKLKL